MQFTTVLLPLFAGLTSAVPAARYEVPAPLEDRQVYTPCSGLTSSAQCCATNVLNLADLDCSNPTTTPANATDFQNICADQGDQAMCCLLPILDQALICVTPTGVESK